MRYDAEIAVAELAKAYLLSVIDAETLAACPVVSFIDPMDNDSPDRFIIDSPDIDTNPASPGNYTAQIEFGVKTQYAQATLAADMAKHFARVNLLRGKLMLSNLMELLTPYLPAGVGLEFVQPRRRFSTKRYVGEKNCWFYSETTLTLQCLATADS